MHEWSKEKLYNLNSDDHIIENLVLWLKRLLIWLVWSTTWLSLSMTQVPWIMNHGFFCIRVLYNLVHKQYITFSKQDWLLVSCFLSFKSLYIQKHKHWHLSLVFHVSQSSIFLTKAAPQYKHGRNLHFFYNWELGRS